MRSVSITSVFSLTLFGGREEEKRVDNGFALSGERDVGFPADSTFTFSLVSIDECCDVFEVA